MRFRRSFAARGFFARLVAAVRGWLPGTPSGATPGRQDAGTTERSEASAAAPSAHAPIRPSAVFHRRFLVTAGWVLGGTVLVGYLIAALVFFPAPIFASSRSVPRVIGMKEGPARERLATDRLRVGAVEHEAHPTVPAGVVVWQDPPAGTLTPEANEVTLTVSDGALRIPVPDVSGYEAEDARLLIQSAGLRVGSTESTQAPTPKNVVVNTRPPAGTTITPGGSVTLVVSVGAATIRVPALKGLTIEEARLALETAGLALGTWFGQTTSETAPGEIFYQEPAAGTLIAPGTSVNVRVARGGS